MKTVYEKSSSEWTKYVKARFTDRQHTDMKTAVKEITKEENKARRKILIAKHQSRFAREAEVENEQDIEEFLQDLSL